MHILVCSVAETGHLMPCLRVARGLAERGHAVTVMTGKPFFEGGGHAKLAKEFDGLSVQPCEGDVEGVVGHFAVETVAKQIAELHARQPIDYAVCDMMASGYCASLHSLGIDYCVNGPSPAVVLWFFGVEGTEDRSWLSWSQAGLLFLMRNVVLRNVVSRHRGISEGRHWLVNSFPEMDSQVPCLPATAQFVGPVAAPAESAPRLDGRFAAFFDRAEEAGLPVVCVSLGSMTVPDSVVANAIYSGLKGGPWRVVWSCKDWSLGQIVEPIDETQFLVTKWIPQNAILADPRCKAMMMHGGWGGTMEACMNGVPLLVLPFFGDQGENARLVESSGWGLALQDQKILDHRKASSEPPRYTGRLTSAEVRSKMSRLLSEPLFAARAREMQAAALRYGGAAKVAEVVETCAQRSVSGEDRRLVTADARPGRSAVAAVAAAVALAALLTSACRRAGAA